MKGFFLKSIFTLAFFAMLAAPAYGQQTNMHATIPPLHAPYTLYTRQLSASYFYMHGRGIASNAIDINTTFWQGSSKKSATRVSLGAALVGSALGGDIVADSEGRDLSGKVLHADIDREYFVGENTGAGLTLFAGVPLSIGDYIIEAQEDVTLYSIMAGVRGGARVTLGAGGFTASPLVMVNVMGGYTEHYSGGVYLANLSTGGIPLFAVLTGGLEVLYRPLGLAVNGVYQRTTGSGENPPMDTVMLQFGYSF